MATGAALAASTFWAFAPTGHEATRGSDPAGSWSQERELTLIESQGTWTILLLAVPVIIAALPLLFGGRKALATVSGALLAVLALLSSFSIGLLYLPAALLLLIGAVLSPDDAHGRGARSPGGPAPHLNENPVP
jgi:hypothetical protein